jgi:hypothetical protein
LALNLVQPIASSGKRSAFSRQHSAVSIQPSALSGQHSAVSIQPSALSPDTLRMKMQNLEIRRKGGSGGMKNKKPNSSATSVPLRFKGFHYFAKPL